MQHLSWTPSSWRTNCLLVYLLVGVGLAVGLPNIKIQVNNANLQSPPYLLEAIKQAELEALVGEPAPVKSVIDQTSDGLLKGDLSQAASASAPISSVASSLDQLPAESSPSAAKEDLGEELLDTDQDGTLRSAHDEKPLAANDESPTLAKKPEVETARKAQAPLSEVTSSHLKRPANQPADELVESELAKASEGAKSLVSASLAPEEPAPSHAELLKRKSHRAPPDVWAPDQVSSNTGTGPAIVNREYGHHSRTKITLGGGYVRDRTPLEPPGQHQLQNSPSNSSPETRIIEVPQRVVLTDQQVSAVEVPTVSLVVANNNKTRSRPRGKPDARCPKSGSTTFEHSVACDKYYFCEEGYLSERTCPNGLMYGLRDIVLDHCVHRWAASCEDKTQPNPVSSPGCRWQYGIFNVQGSPRCTPDYYECRAGQFEVKKCALDGQVYDDRTKSCRFAEQVGCLSEALADFQCPPDDQSNTYWPFPRYFLNERALIHCINDQPQIVRCAEHERVDPEHLHCVLSSKLRLPGSEDPAALAARRLPSVERKKTKLAVQ